MCVCLCVCVCVRVRVHVFACVRVHVCMHTCTYTCIFACMYMFIYAYICAYVCMSLCVYVICMYSADQTQVNSCMRVYLESRAGALRAHFVTDMTRVRVCTSTHVSVFEHTRERVYKTLRRSLVYAGILLTSVLYYCVFSSTTFKMPRVSLETRRRIVAISKSGYSVPDIQNRLAEEKIYTSKVSIYKILKNTNNME